MAFLIFGEGFNPYKHGELEEIHANSAVVTRDLQLCKFGQNVDFKHLDFDHTKAYILRAIAETLRRGPRAGGTAHRRPGI